MTPSAQNHSNLAPTTPSAEDAACVRALAVVREELLAIPAADVLLPKGGERTLAADVLALAAAASREDAEKEVQLVRLERLALALMRAQHEFLLEAPRSSVAEYHSLVIAAEQAFADVEELRRVLILREVVARRALPRRPGRAGRKVTLDDRCEYMSELVLALIEHDHDEATEKLLRRAQKLAYRLEGPRPSSAPGVSAREIRNRAYTALQTALHTFACAPHDAEPSRERSGVFAIEIVDGVLTGVRSA